jgi:heme oxygenase (mycobilin-producing)
MVKVFIKRKVVEGQVGELMNLLKKLRAMTLSQPGYIPGETMKRIDQPGECLVISTWHSAQDWLDWLNNEERSIIQDEIDGLLGEKTEYAVYG